MPNKIEPNFQEIVAEAEKAVAAVDRSCDAPHLKKFWNAC